MKLNRHLGLKPVVLAILHFRERLERAI